MLVVGVTKVFIEDPGSRAAIRLVQDLGLATTFRHALDGWTRAAERFLAEAVEGGEVRGDLEMHSCAIAIVDSLFGALSVSATLNEPEGLEERIGFIWTLLSHGVLPNMAFPSDS
jgi:hypothetical protein